MGLLAASRSTLRHSPEGLESELFEKGQQLVVRLKTLWSSFHWIGLGQCLFLQGKVGIEIDLGSFDGLMAKPKRNHGSIHAGL